MLVSSGVCDRVLLNVDFNFNLEGVMKKQVIDLEVAYAVDDIFNWNMIRGYKLTSYEIEVIVDYFYSRFNKKVMASRVIPFVFGVAFTLAGALAFPLSLIIIGWFVGWFEL
mgnify:CR=1 FL=1